MFAFCKLFWSLPRWLLGVYFCIKCHKATEEEVAQTIPQRRSKGVAASAKTMVTKPALGQRPSAASGGTKAVQKAHIKQTPSQSRKATTSPAIPSPAPTPPPKRLRSKTAEISREMEDLKEVSGGLSGIGF